MSHPTAAERLRRKVDRIDVKHKGDMKAADQEINETLDGQEILTTGLLPWNSKLRARILGAFLRDKEQKARVAEQLHNAREEEMVPVVVAGGGKCNITVWMTKEQAERERASR